ncbi:JAB domain-containing protein [Anaeromyxobacter oryzisoli]|uniref:JAB domain-containing protein n=1 Tax=Anaeromyxobacter oryzisoli TaxID=2925408 RepID=UPI001F5A524D|nr:JAB domain-containing protein [Anaeromyxobacter sp. SG63]
MLAVHERMFTSGARAMSDEELLRAVTGCELGSSTLAAVSSMEIAELAWSSAGELAMRLALTKQRAAMLAAAFELGRRGAWSPPKRGERVLDPGRVYELMRPLAHAPVEEFHVVLLDVRGRLLRTERIAQGSLTQCPVNPRDVFRTAVREAAHGIVFVHNHPSSVMRRSLLRAVSRRSARLESLSCHSGRT